MPVKSVAKQVMFDAKPTMLDAKPTMLDAKSTMIDAKPVSTICNKSTFYFYPI
jgi:hypothetical protein